jgi:hypothetical protein
MNDGLVKRSRAELAELIEWWDILDDLVSTGSNRITFSRAVERARACRHVDAQWLASLVPAGMATTREEELRVLQAGAQEDDARALYVLGRLTYSDRSLRRSAELGYAPAQAARCFWCDEPREVFCFAQLAAQQGDRCGKWQLGECYYDGSGCEQDETTALALWREAAEMGQRDAQYRMGCIAYGAEDWQRYRFWGSAAARGNWGSVAALISKAAKQLRLYNEGGSGRIVFELGAAYRGHTDKERVFSVVNLDDAVVAQRCVNLHEQWTALAKAAVECWLMTGRRFGVAKDIRLLIARSLWRERADWSSVRLT